ncbi:MAG: S8 family serine peptidase, partial [Bacteroidales bacterium]|nr:S8 family serine peptidase [Bacteroidales bacterium]
GGSQFEMLEFGDGGSSTIVGHPNAAGAISVGAVRFDKNPTYNPGDFPVPVIMSFSSVGGTPVNGVVRNKPDITAPNGVNTTVDLGNGDWDSPIDPDILFPNFFGTSAASPHAAGVAALIMEAKLKYDSVSHVTSDTIRALLKSTAIDGDDPGEDRVSGSGFIQAHKAIMTFANPSPYVENLILASEGGVPGEEITPFSFTITGDFFTNSTLVLFRGEPLETGVVVVDESTITVDHEGFIGNPEVQVYNPVISGSGLDGGGSNEKYFSDSVKQKVFITANNLTKKFGELSPEFTANFLVVTVEDDSLSLEEAVSGGIMLQEEAMRLTGLAYNVPADVNSDAGQYIIVPSLYPEVNPGEIDLSISERFILEFNSGALTIEKLSLTITPLDASLVYGQILPANGFDFSYQIGDSSLVITNLDSILQSVQQEHTDALTNEIALVRGVALVNGIPVIRGTALVNGVTMLRGIALVNGVEVKVEVEGSDTTVYVAGEPLVNVGSLIRGVALVNDKPFVSMTEIIRGVALVNGDEVTFDDGYMTELNGTPLVNKVLAVRGVALVNGLGSRGIALVNGHTIVVENGITKIDNVAVPTNGIALVNGIPVIRGTALVNSSLISRGVALVNGLEVVIENGVPTGRGIALVNGLPTLRGIALVNGLPLIRGTALVNNLEVHVDDGEVSQVFENGTPLVNGLTMSRGIALVNGTALVNGSQLISRGTALVNGIALTDDEGDGEDLVDLENMNFMASSAALANGLNS